MAHFYEHIYASLRGAMIDRNHGDKLDEAVLIDFKSAQVALKKEIPSAALLIAYSMLYYPNWLNNSSVEQGFEPSMMPIENFIGGVNNYKFPLLFNIYMGMIAAAVGNYAGLYKLKYSPILQTTVIIPNMENSLVKETQRMIKENHLTYKDARDIFIYLMQQEEYRGDIPLADDYIANATFIPDVIASKDNDDWIKTQKTIAVDFKKEFEKETRKNG